MSAETINALVDLLVDTMPEQMSLFEQHPAVACTFEEFMGAPQPPAVLADGTEVRMYFTCPGCGHHWHGATLVIGAWWYTKPEQVAKHPCCPKCDHRPPMPFTCEPPL